LYDCLSPVAALVGKNDNYPTNPDGKKGPHNDKAYYDLVDNTCGKTTQAGELRFYPGIDLSHWPNNRGSLNDNDPKKWFGNGTPCRTTAGFLHAVGTKPDFWTEDGDGATLTGRRSFSVDYKCCFCDPRKERTGTATADPPPTR
jgi:hypothetical protein